MPPARGQLPWAAAALTAAGAVSKHTRPQAAQLLLLQVATEVLHLLERMAVLPAALDEQAAASGSMTPALRAAEFGSAALSLLAAAAAATRASQSVAAVGRV